MKHDRLIKNEKTLCFVKDHYEQYTLKFNKLTESALTDSIVDLTSPDSLVDSTSTSSTNQPISIDNEEENENAAFHAQRFTESHADQQALADL